jgi:thiol-disulfide isomerase/thioredoxin
MKKIFLIAMLALTIAGQSHAQFKISGQLINSKKPDTLTLRIPFVYDYYTTPVIKIPVNGNGSFTYTIPLSTQKFATLTYQHKTTTLLLKPGKSLTIVMDTTGAIQNFGGTTASVNQTLYYVKLNEASFFMQDNSKTNAYAKLNFAQVQEQVVKPWLAMRNESIKQIVASRLSEPDKKLIAAEIKYHAYTELDNFVRTTLTMNFKESSKILLSVYEGATPNPDIFPAGPMYYYYANSYLGYLENQVFATYDAKDEKSKEPFFRTYKMTMDSATRMVKLKGKNYFKWYVLNLYFNRDVAERYLAQNIYNQVYDKDISHALLLMADFKTYFPQSAYTGILQQKVDELTTRYQQNAGSSGIKIWDGYSKITSIYDVVNQLKGKVIYLDVWGTWCPPCKEELRFNPQLKQHFKDKNVVFVYLDMDDDLLDANWRSFIAANGLTGIHLRKSKTDIQPFWDELLPAKGKRENYPSYFIFDKNGKLVQADAKRPSDEGALYNQIEKYL